MLVGDTWSAVCQGLLPSRRHFEKREDPGDEVGMASTGIVPFTTLLPTHVKRVVHWNQIVFIRLGPTAECLYLSSFRDSWQLVLATILTAFPTSLSLCLNVEEFRVGMFMVDSTLLIWVWPIPAWRQPRATRVLTSKADGPRLPDLCSPEV